MREFDRAALEGLTLEEAVSFLVPRGWDVMVHRYEDIEYPLEELARTYKVKIDENGYDVDRPLVSLDIQDGKVYDFTMHVPVEEK